MGVPPGVRLTEAEVAAIRRIVAQHFGPDAEVRVFGSRTRPEVRGGDLDLHILVPGPRPGLNTEGLAVWDIEDALDGLPVDLVISSRSETPTRFEQHAMTTGIPI